MDNQNPDSPYKWYMLALSTLTNTLVVAAPSMSLPVLFKEISTDLNLSLVQVGLVWGISALPGIVTGLAGGIIGDRFGPKRVLAVSCLLVGLTGAARGLANGFPALAAIMVLSGLFGPFIPLNNLKACGTWFPSRQLGLASGVLSMGMALGFLLGSMLSATVLSPWLGGWRHVMFFYGALALLLFIPWLLARPGPESAPQVGVQIGQPSLRQAVAHVVRIRNVILLGAVLLGISGCLQGTLGYLPLYLRGQGWSDVGADGALAAFHTISMTFVVPIALFSDRIGSRKKVLVVAGLMTVLGVGLLSVAQGALVWLAVCMAGMVRDGFMAVYMAAIIETEGIGMTFTGTATGVTMVFSGIGNLVSPALGNSLSTISPGLPFVFWAALAGAGFLVLLAAREKRASRALATE